MMIMLKLCPFAFLLCAILTPVCRRVFHRFQILDQPDVGRKRHSRAVPRVGGIPLFVSYVITIALYFGLTGRSEAMPVIRELIWPILPAATVVFLTGVLDDMVGLRWRQKLIPQLVAALMVVGGHVHVPVPPSGLGMSEVAVRAIGLFLSVCWIIGCTNAMNLIDGVDGLAAGVGLVTTLTCLIVGVTSHDMTLVLVTAPLAACIGAFLIYNFAPASIFLGDCGSLTLGFMVGCMTLLWSHHTNGPLRMLAPAIAVALPLLDVCLSIGRRYLREAPIAGGDRGHIHHKVLSKTASVAKTSIILYCVAAISGCLALSQHFEFLRPHGVTLAMALILVVVGVKALGYTEFAAALQALSRQRVMGNVRDEILMSELDGVLDAANTPDEVWYAVGEICSRMKLHALSMQFMGVSFEAPRDPVVRREALQVLVRFGSEGELVLRSAGSGSHIASFARIEQLQEALGKKVGQLTSEGASETYVDKGLLRQPVLS
jgi:UDP-GlcNAc:undecaprenyl-phosphate GlcNAc-1-phosphate transferase